MALHRITGGRGAPIAQAVNGKEERAELQRVVARIEADGETLRKVAGTRPAVWHLLRCYGYWRDDRDNASKRLRLLAAARAVAADESAAGA